MVKLAKFSLRLPAWELEPLVYDAIPAAVIRVWDWVAPQNRDHKYRGIGELGEVGILIEWSAERNLSLDDCITVSK